MTLHATRNRDKGTVTVHAAYGTIQLEVVETEGHALQFWHDLGKLIAAEDNETRAKAGWERYAAHHAEDDMPGWDQLHAEERGHWVAAFTE